MTICIALYTLLGISLLVTSFSAFRISPAMRAWINQAQTKTSLTLAELATLPTEEALKSFYKFFLFAAAVLLGGSFLSDKVFNSAAKGPLSLSFFVCLYSGLSIRAWSENRQEIFNKFLAEIKSETVKYPKYFAIFSLILLTAAASFSVAAGEFALRTFTSLATFMAAGLLSLFLSIWLANSASLAIVFGPALAATSFLWLSIQTARVCLWVGSQKLINFLVLYAILGTMYFTAIGVNDLRTQLGLPLLCH